MNKKVLDCLYILASICSITGSSVIGISTYFGEPIDNIHIEQLNIELFAAVIVGLSILTIISISHKYKKENVELQKKLAEQETYSESSVEESHILYKDIISEVRHSVNKFHEKQKEYEKLISNSTNIAMLSNIHDQYMYDREELIYSSGIKIIDFAYKAMKEFASRKYGVNENFRVVIKVVHQIADKKQEEWEFNNALWDSHTWNSKMQYKTEEELHIRHKINSNSAICDLATKKSHLFAGNDLSKNINGKPRYYSHNEIWNDIYNAKILTSIENRRRNVLYGFVSIDTPNKKNVELFSEDERSIPLNIAMCVSEALSILFGEAEDYHFHLEGLEKGKKCSLAHQNKEEGIVERRVVTME